MDCSHDYIPSGNEIDLAEERFSRSADIGQAELTKHTNQYPPELRRYEWLLVGEKLRN